MAIESDDFLRVRIYHQLNFSHHPIQREISEIDLASGAELDRVAEKFGVVRIGRGRLPTMTKDEAAIETELQAKGLNAPRLTPDQIDSTIAGEEYYVFPGTTLTICALKLRNGFVVTGESAAASPENFDEYIGRMIARQNARDKIWALEGYLLRSRLAEEAGAVNKGLPCL